MSGIHPSKSAKSRSLLSWSRGGRVAIAPVPFQLQSRMWWLSPDNPPPGTLPIDSTSLPPDPGSPGSPGTIVWPSHVVPGAPPLLPPFWFGVTLWLSWRIGDEGGLRVDGLAGGEEAMLGIVLSS